MTTELFQLQAQAKFFLESCQLEQALQAYEQLYTWAASNSAFTPEILDDYAELLTSLGSIQLAKTIYTQSIHTFPSENCSKYFALGQLLSGQEAVDLYLQGISIANESEKTQISQAYTALSEIYMTDLCDLPDAEQKCEEYIKKAIEANEYSFEAYLALSHLRLVRGRVDEAKLALERAKEVLRNCNSENLPSIEGLVNASKNFVECEDFEGLEFVTEVGLGIDDSNHELIYMHGFALFKLGHTEEAVDCLTQLLKLDLKGEIKEACEEILSSVLNPT